jgi:hypothetical protein
MPAFASLFSVTPGRAYDYLQPGISQFSLRPSLEVRGRGATWVHDFRAQPKRIARMTGALTGSCGSGRGEERGVPSWLLKPDGREAVHGEVRRMLRIVAEARPRPSGLARFSPMNGALSTLCARSFASIPSSSDG